MNRTTLCYLFDGQKVLLLHRVKKEHDENAGMYVGLGGHFESGESPEDCMLREVYEESGVVPDRFSYRGVVLFHSDIWPDEEMHLFTATATISSLPDCDEGELRLVERRDLFSLPMWEGDRIFLRLLLDGAPFFHLELFYAGPHLDRAILDGRPLNAGLSGG